MVPILKYIGHKAKSVRWQPVDVCDLRSSTIFATGSYDDKVNKVYLWSYKNTDGVLEPNQISQQTVPSDVTDMMFMKCNMLLVTLANGSVLLMNTDNEILKDVHVWENIHHYDNQSPSSCNVVAQYSQSSSFVITGGDDGRILVLTTDPCDILETIETKDSTPITSLLCYYHSQVLASNFSGQLMLWDIRSKPSVPLKTFAISHEQLSVECLTSHPNQPHIIAAGCSNGMISLLDIRQEKMPVSLIQAHSHEVWEARFHSQFPDNLITCSQDGSLLHWSHKDRSVSGDSVWLTDAISRGQIDVSNLVPTKNSMSVNSFDISSNCLIAVTDSEAMYVLPDVDFH